MMKFRFQQHRRQHPFRSTGILLSMLLSLLVGGCNLHFDLNTVELAGADTSGDAADVEADGESPADAESPDGNGDATVPDARDADSGTNADAISDANSDAISDANSDAISDADAVSDADAPDADLPPGQCSAESLANVGTCGPNRPAACDLDQTCRLSLDTTNFRFFTRCYDNAAGAGNRAEGESCQGGSSCMPGLDCAAWGPQVSETATCAKLCVLETGLGCDPQTEFCTNPSPSAVTGLGFCAKRCVPPSQQEQGAQRDDCGSGKTCVPDFGFPESTCSQNFRCLLDRADIAKSPGDPCSREDHHENGCGLNSGLICVPKSGDDICVKPCASDDDCGTDGHCSPLGDGWEIRFCEI